MRRLRDIHVWLVGYDMVSLSLYHILVLARFIYFLNYGRAMHSLCKVDVVSAQSSLVSDTRSSLPERNYNVVVVLALILIAALVVVVYIYIR